MAAVGASKGSEEQIETISQAPVQHGRDAAAEFLSKNVVGRVTLSTEDDKRVLRQIDKVILPIMLVVYFLQALDKATLAYSSVFGLIQDTDLVGDQYGWLGSIVYIAQLVMQPPLAWLLVRIPIAKFTSAMVFFWGVTLCCMAGVNTFGSLMAARFFLGAFEASVAPSFVAITAMWWKRGEQTTRTGYWYAMNGATNMFGSLISYGLGHIQGTLHSYQIIFIFFGLITVIFAFVMLWFMPDSPVEAKFLNDNDKAIALERLRANQMGVVSRKWRNDHLKEVLIDPKTALWFALIFAISVPSGGITTFGPLIIATFGFDKYTTILFNIPFGFMQLVGILGGSFLAKKIKMKGPVIALLCLPPIAGCVMLMVLPKDPAHSPALLVAYYLISLFTGIIPLIYSWSMQNTGGDTKRKCTNATLFIGQSSGNIVGPLLYTQTEAPHYSRGLRSNLALYVVIIILCVITTFYLRHINKVHGARRVAMGKSAVIMDKSMETPEETVARKAPGLGKEEGTDLSGDPETNTAGEKAFDDLTDLQNEEFIFVY